MKVTETKLEKLIPYARNPRKNQGAVDAVAGSIKEFGFRVPIVCDPEMVVIAGHTRLQAATKLGMKTVPVHIAEGLSEQQVKAFRLADNRVAEESEWDMELLRLELEEISYPSTTGFSEDELAEILKQVTEGLTDPDDVPAVTDASSIFEGDLIELGNHRLVCGDATNKDHVELALGGITPMLMTTDPPYGTNYDDSWRVEQGLSKSSSLMPVTNDHESHWNDAWALFPGNVAYVWTANGPLHCGVYEDLLSAGLECKHMIIWAKSSLVIGRGRYHHQHESCWYAVRKGETSNWYGDRKQSTLWQIDKPRKNETGHSTQKPIECMKRPVENSSSPGQAVYDPFLGSGTTMIACEMTGRQCIGLELEPQFCDVIITRWCNFTGGDEVMINGKLERWSDRVVN